MNVAAQILRLVARIRELEDRIDELEQADFEDGTDAIGFEVDSPEEFDEDASEYKKRKRSKKDA